MLVVAQGQGAVASHVYVDDLDIRFDIAEVVAGGQIVADLVDTPVRCGWRRLPG